MARWQRLPRSTPIPTRALLAFAHSLRWRLTSVHTEDHRHFGDLTPLHVDGSYAKQTRFGGRILNGTFMSALPVHFLGSFARHAGLSYFRARPWRLNPPTLLASFTSRWMRMSIPRSDSEGEPESQLHDPRPIGHVRVLLWQSVVGRHG